MANPKHLKLLQGGSAELNDWRKKHPREHLDLQFANLEGLLLEGADLSVANFTSAYLHGADFQNAELIESNFTSSELVSAIFVDAKLVHACLNRANLGYADFEGADLEGADIEDADLEGAYMVGSNLSRASLRGAKFYNTDLAYANFSDAVLGYTVFGACDLRLVKGLESVIHEGPSSIGIETILRSEGDIPYSFLKGCGVPDHVIEFVDSIARKPIQYYSCFISHGEPDAEIAKHLHDKLQGAGVRCWFFHESARTGEPLWSEINRAIRLYDKLIIVCSRDSLQRKGVLREIREGLQREKSEKLRHLKDEELVANGKLNLNEFAKRKYHTQVFFPITIDNYIYDEWVSPLKTELTNRVIGDFRNWEDFKTFDNAFQKLLKDLNSSD